MTVLAAIDIGTISTRLLIGDVKKDRLTPLHQELYITRIGKDVNQTKKLNSDRMEDTIEVLERYRELCDQQGAEEIFAVGTSAIRETKNGLLFKEKVLKKTGIDFRIIEGLEEAELTFLGASKAFMSGKDPVIVIDVGGGSTEIIGGIQKSIRFLKSFDAGAVRMTEKHISTDPVSSDEYRRLCQDIHENMKLAVEDLNSEEYPLALGVGGTATTLAAVDLQLKEYDPKRVHGHSLSTESISKLIDDFRGMTTDQKKRLAGLQPKRADLVLAGAVILFQLLEYGKWQDICISEADILHGILWKQFMENGRQGIS